MSFICHSATKPRPTTHLFKNNLRAGSVSSTHNCYQQPVSNTLVLFLRLKNAKAEYLTGIKLCICINKVIKELMAETLEKWQAVNYTAYEPHVLKKWAKGESKTGGSVTGSSMSASKRSMKLWTQKSTIVSDPPYDAILENVIHNRFTFQLDPWMPGH